MRRARLLVTFGAVLAGVSVASAAFASASLGVALRPPVGVLTMGDLPVFLGTVTNAGHRVTTGLVVYLSLVSLETGNEHPVDLEDWSAEKAVRIDVLPAGSGNSQRWPIRLIQSGPYGVALTVVDPGDTKPIVSDLVRFYVRSRPMISSARILPVAIGEPVLLLLLMGLVYLRGARGRGRRDLKE